MDINGLITLRAPELSDIDSLYLWENDETLWQAGRVAMPLSRFAIRNYIESASDNPFASQQLRLLINLSSSGEAIGFVDLSDISAVNANAEIGIFISPAHRGNGYATETVRKICAYAGPAALHLHSLVAKVSRDNIASHRLFTRCGFKSAGCLKNWLRTGTRRCDLIIYQIAL